MTVSYRSIIFCMECKILIHSCSAALTIQIEIRMICHICNCRLIADSLIMDPQFVVFRKLIFYRHIKFSRETILAIRTYTVKYNTVFIIGNLSHFPEFLFKPIRSAVKIVVILVLCKYYFFSMNGESGFGNTITTSSDRSTKKASIYFIRCQIIISKYYVC